MTITISVNGESQQIADNTSVAELLGQSDITATQVAVAINQVFVPRDQHDQHIIQDSDAIDILSPVQGG